MTAIVLADDHHIVRQGLRALLESVPDFRVVGEAANGQEAVRLVEELRPEILIIDLMMPGMTGLEVVRHIRQQRDDPQVIMLSMHANEAYVLEALRSGASGYVLKEAQGADLITAVRQVLAGRRYLSPPLSEQAIESYMQRAQESLQDGFERVTAREREVLQLVAQGCSTAEIAARLLISPRTVETHRANLMRKLGLHSQRELVRFALRRGIVSLDH